MRLNQWRVSGLASLLLLSSGFVPMQAQTVSCTGVSAWVATTTYATGAQVTYSGKLYKALVSTTNVQPDYCPACGWWQLVGTCGTTGTCTTVPAVPTGLASPSQTTTSVNLSWSSVSTPANCTVTYSVFQGSTQVASGLSGTTATVSGLTANTTYSFSVAAVDAAGSSAKSTALSVKTAATSTCTTAPAVPSGLTSPSQTSTSVNLSWSSVSAPTGCTVTYSVFQGTTQVASGLTGTSTTISGLTASTTYSFSVTAVDAAGSSAKSSAISVKTAAVACSAAPAVPTGLASPSQTANSVNLSWTAVSTPAGCSVTYNVYNGSTLAATVPTTTAVISGLTASTTYSFSVASVDAAGTSAKSTALSVKTAASGSYTAATVLAGIQKNMTSAKQVNTLPHKNTMTGAFNVNVYQVDTGVFAYASGMAIDTDGSDPDPDPDHQGQTTWTDNSGKYLGAHTVPFYVLGDDCWDNEGGANYKPCPHFFYSEHNITGLQFALIFYNGKVIGAVFGDTQTANDQTTSDNDARELGEASVKAASMLGIPSSGTSGGVDSGVTVVIFSGSSWVVKGTSSAILNTNAQAMVQTALNKLGADLGL